VYEEYKVLQNDIGKSFYVAFGDQKQLDMKPNYDISTLEGLEILEFLDICYQVESRKGINIFNFRKCKENIRI
jgi:hypothetical protein